MSGARRLGYREPGDEHRYRECTFRPGGIKDSHKPLKRLTEAEQEAALVRLQAMIREATTKVLAPGHGFNSERSKQSENGGQP